MQHKPRIYVHDDPSDTKLLFVTDMTEYDSMIPVENRILEIKVPGVNDTRVVPFPKGKQTYYDSVIMGLFNSDCPNPLPDGLYTVKFSMAPNTELFHQVLYFRVAALENRIFRLISRVQLECPDGVDDCGNHVMKKVENLIMHSWMLCQSAKFNGRIEGLSEPSYNQYRQAENDLNVVEKSFL